MQQEILLKLITCKNYVRLLNKSINEEEKVKLWFEQLCSLLANLLYNITNYVKNQTQKLEKPAKDTILLYLTQLTSSLGLLIQIFIKESSSDIIITEARNCVKKQLLWCLDGLEELLNANKSYVDTSGSFIKWMDAALEQLTHIDLTKSIHECINNFQKSKHTTEEVLCHAMSIAQIALIQDSKIIKGSSQAVLEAFEDLNKELAKCVPNIALANLFIDCCNDKLCALERRVNEAVLKLCLKLFANFIDPLHNLYEFCLNNNDEDKLDMLIADFDTHVDQIMQVGLFAVACTTDNKYCVKMRSCLASLEALEVELVPAFNALLKEKSLLNTSLAFLLKNYWIHQANALKNLIYPIVDPYAYAKVIYEENDCTLNNIIDDMKKHNYVLDNAQLEIIINNASVLKEMITVSLADAAPFNETNVKAQLKDFKDVLYELKASSNILLSTKSNLRETSLRIIKRCKILLTVHKRLLITLLEDNTCNDNVIKNTEQETMNKIEIEKNGKENYTSTKENPTLDHLILRGKQLIKDRSVLYKTPTKNKEETESNFVQKQKIFTKTHEMPLSKLVPMRNMIFFNSLLKKENCDTTIDLQVTDILEELTVLGSSFKP